MLKITKEIILNEFKNIVYATTRAVKRSVVEESPLCK